MKHSSVHKIKMLKNSIFHTKNGIYNLIETFMVKAGMAKNLNFVMKIDKPFLNYRFKKTDF